MLTDKGPAALTHKSSHDHTLPRHSARNAVELRVSWGWYNFRARGAPEALRDISELPAEVDDGPDDVLLRREQEAEFMSFLERLPAPQRAVLLLHYVEDFSIEQIAGITQSELGTVKSRMHYAKKALRKLLEEKR